MSGVTLTVDGPAWRTHLRHLADTTPGLVPVAKGNGYGFGLDTLAREAQRLGVDTIAVGIPGEVALVRDHFDGDIVILNPWSADDPVAVEVAADPRVISTVSRVDDLARLAGAEGRPRVLVEVLTSMRRHGLAPTDLAKVNELGDAVSFEGWVIHLPHVADGRTAEAEQLAAACNAVRSAPLWFSHLAGDDAARIATGLGTTHRLRIGTNLWLGAPATRSATTTVLDVHPVRRGERVGYWRRRVPADGWLVIVAGGTANGIGMEAPTSARSARSRVISVATGSLAALGRALSPFTIDGKKRWFAEPPHMQSSMVLLPGSATPPAVGDQLPVEVRLTTAQVDQLVITEAAE
ncbi:alanine racemase [Microlunatus sp. Y2014]|uniref:alanine racemase n=1 Tax=Microlunatus sp. Y2014 TaxID=3418488 RepID=UPI003DA6D852